MGSPSKLGQELNKLHKPKVDWFLLILLVAAMGLGFANNRSWAYERFTNEQNNFCDS